jgi:hypothetical protein
MSWHTTCLDTPNALTSWPLVTPSAYCNRMERTWSSVKEVLGWLGPKQWLLRPRFFRSSALSCKVPTLRCLGLQHIGLSQECRTNSSSPMTLHSVKANATLAATCTIDSCFQLGRHTALPFLVAPNHGQQCSLPPTRTSLLTRLQKPRSW